jgi:hypothetical protein
VEHFINNRNIRIGLEAKLLDTVKSWRPLNFSPFSTFPMKIILIYNEIIFLPVFVAQNGSTASSAPESGKNVPRYED